ncbi:MAG TPA: TonB family protein [Methylophilus sp.]|uniref:TonB family protein n=1 Tax=Methylophilus sp. TaxID=29541 RepID=UPI002BF477E4|nr:TonB family protein [Methylophilus sp.]HSH87777.1 TonB family protein [Methylophilus sp.]
MRYISILILSLSFISASSAERDIDSITEIAQAYREQKINAGPFGVREEVRKHLFTKGHIIFPDATNLPTSEDINKKWVNAKLLKIAKPTLSIGKSAYVEVAILIDESGSVADTYIIESSNDHLNAAAETAVRTWKFKPASVEDQTRKAVWIIPFIF